MVLLVDLVVEDLEIDLVLCKVVQVLLVKVMQVVLFQQVVLLNVVEAVVVLHK